MRAVPVRRAWVLIHRYVGLFLAGFLILEGLTGSILAFETPISEWLAPQTFAPPRPGVPALGLGALAEHLEAIEPKARVGFFSIDGRQAGFSMLPRTDPATGKPYALPFDHIVLDPWTGAELARLRNGELSQGPANIVPFIYKLHQNLAMGGWGTILLGVAAVLWTLDCFVAVYLTLPVSTSRFLPRWKPAWLIKWRSSGFRITFDLHRASGLWLWPLLFVLAWSSVMFTLPEQVFDPVTKALFSYRSDAETMAAMSARPSIPHPKLTWAAAQAAGERLMAQMAARRGFRIERPYGMAYIPDWGVYTYSVIGSANIQAHGWETSLWLDGDTGALVSEDVPGAEPIGNDLTTWLRALHFGDLRDSLIYRTILCASGFAVSLLSVTGVLIWLKKRRAEGVRRERHGQTPRRPAVIRPDRFASVTPKPTSKESRLD
jgi:uncharacterized iron-regulated membrane protein